MQTNDDILSLLEEKGAQVAREAQRAVILQPGALGDCILTLPLARVMKEALGLGGVDIIGHTEYIGILPGRSCVSSVRSMDSTDLHRLFAEANTFDLEDRDPLINAFADYAWIVTFMGEANGNFEQNLIFTANCSHSAEIITLSLKPPRSKRRHIAEYYVEQFANQSGLAASLADVAAQNVLIHVTPADRNQGLELLDQVGVDVSKRLVILHPGSGGRRKCWHLENFTGIARTLREADVEVLFLLGPAEMERLGAAEMSHIRGSAKFAADLSLTDVVGLLGCADAFVGNDSGVTHLAAGMGLRTVAMFGPTDPALYRPIGPALTVFRDSQNRFTRLPCCELQHSVAQSLLSGMQNPPVR
ncbi:MAG: glycosyltransferase family 9 protein [Sedimentisphaerales bacterium]|nr:glycosyltransferase family 9 protein [Sedimentisphaerales bacterium]